MLEVEVLLVSDPLHLGYGLAADITEQMGIHMLEAEVLLVSESVPDPLHLGYGLAAEVTG